MSENPAEYGEIEVIETEPESEESRKARLEYKKKRIATQKESMKKRFAQTGVKGFIVYCHMDAIENLRKYAKSLTEVILEKQRKEFDNRPPATESDKR